MGRQKTDEVVLECDLCHGMGPVNPIIGYLKIRIMSERVMSHAGKYILIMKKNLGKSKLLNFWPATKKSKISIADVKAQRQYNDETENVLKDDLRLVYCGKHKLTYVPDGRMHTGNIYKLIKKS